MIAQEGIDADHYLRAVHLLEGAMRDLALSYQRTALLYPQGMEREAVQREAYLLATKPQRYCQSFRCREGCFHLLVAVA